MKATYKDFIGIYKNAISPDFCDYVIKSFEKPNSKSSTQIHKRPLDSSGREFKQDTAVDGRLLLNQKDVDYVYTQLGFLLQKYIEKYRTITHLLGDGYIIDDLKIQKTKPTEGYHPWHFEYHAGEMYNRRWGVYTIYLNDIEEGGETEFLYQSQRVKPKKGTVCIFPAYFTHTHRGNPTLKGNKYIITGWFLYPESIIKKFNENPPQNDSTFLT